MLALRTTPCITRPSGAVSTIRATQNRQRVVRVRSSAEPEPEQQPRPQVVRPHSTSGPKVSAFEEVMGFAGTAPEIVNGRLAQLGFLAAVGAELATQKPVVSQLSGAVGPIAATFALFIVASLVPIFKGVKSDESFGPLTSAAELANGRWAMIGFAGLLITEAVKGSALF